MIDTYTMILWAKANNNGIDTQAKQVFDILNTLSQVPYLRPKYLTAYQKKDTTEFELTLENIEKLITKKRDKQFEELGSKISFFTSLNDNESVGISISIGVSKAKFQNTVVLDLNFDYKKQSVKKFDELSEIFKKFVIIFAPFYGCITSRSNGSMFDTYYDKTNNTPTSIFDINYWGIDIINNLPISEIQEKVFECIEMNRGYYIRLQKEPVNISNIDHIKLQKDINCLLGI